MASPDTLRAGRHTRLADSDSDDDPQHVLTLAKASDLCPKPYRLVARNQNITSLADLSSLTALDYIDLRSNSLTSLEGIDHPRLKTLIVANNQLTQLKPVYTASTIRILNVSENQLPDLEWLPHTSFAAHLLTLVASSNLLHSLAGVISLSSLQTLVISNNEIEDLTPITHIKSLVKVSASKNQIRVIPCLASLEQLVELRLAHNRITTLPDGRVSKLQILDMGHNRLSEIGALPTFAPRIVQVNLRQNPVCQRKDFGEYLNGLCDRLEVIDGHRIAGGRRKVRVNRIRKAVGFDIEHDRKFARMPSAYYVNGVKEKRSLADTAKEDKNGNEREHDELRHDVEVGAEKFVEMARAKAQNGQAYRGLTSVSRVKLHSSTAGDEFNKERRKRRKRDGEEEGTSLVGTHSFGDGGASRW